MDSGVATYITVQEHKKDLSKLRCYKCQNLGHYAFQCSHKKIKVRNGEKKKNKRSTPKQKKKDLSKTKCNKCLIVGHFVY